MYALALGQLFIWNAHIIPRPVSARKGHAQHAPTRPLSALPRNILERVACTLIVLTAGLCWAYVLGEVCAIVSDAWPEMSWPRCEGQKPGRLFLVDAFSLKMKDHDVMKGGPSILIYCTVFVRHCHFQGPILFIREKPEPPHMDCQYIYIHIYLHINKYTYIHINTQEEGFYQVYQSTRLNLGSLNLIAILYGHRCDEHQIQLQQCHERFCIHHQTRLLIQCTYWSVG